MNFSQYTMNVSKKITLTTDIRYLKGIGPKQTDLFAKLGVLTVADLLQYKPRRWDDFSQLSQIADLQPGRVTVKAQILEASGRYLGYRGLHLTEALVQDETGYLRIVWFNQPYRANSLKLKSWYYLSGLYDLRYKHLQLINPSIQLINDDNQEVNLVRPVYPTTIGLKNTQIQRALMQARLFLSDLPEILPAWMIKSAQLESLATAYEKLHFPQTIQQTEEALEDLSLRELIALSLSSQILKQQRAQQRALSIALKKDAVQKVIDNLDFNLTGQQEKITFAVLEEMSRSKLMLNRLIQGDVGSGKTVIAALIAFNVIQNGYQVALLVPTQILAQQHFQELQTIYKDLLKERQMEILTSASTAKEKKRILDQIADGQTKLVIGTHTLLAEAVKFNNLALVIIDEQHRFGVEQRLRLIDKATPRLANILTLSATPIPRSLALVVYADLDISLLTEKPPLRKPVITSIIPLKERSERLRQVLAAKASDNQIYIICPAIDDSNIEDSLTKIKSYITNLDPRLKCTLLHARLPSETKEKVMSDFKSGKYEALLSTSIVGAGLDIPNANTVIIFSPERFGLAQLHQFRGRVGRRAAQGYCYLCPFSDQLASERLQALMDHQDGFRLSEIDLKLRGPGALRGLRQSGASVIFQIGSAHPRAIKLATDLAAEFILKGENLNQLRTLQAIVKDYQQITHLN